MVIKKLPKCCAGKETLDKHGCHYLLSSNDGIKVCGSPCAQILITTIEKLKSENETLRFALNQMKAEL